MITLNMSNIQRLVGWVETVKPRHDFIKDFLHSKISFISIKILSKKSRKKELKSERNVKAKGFIGR